MLKVAAVTMLLVVLTTEALPSAQIGENRPTATEEEGLKDPKVSEDAIVKAYLEAVGVATAVLEAMGEIVDGLVQNYRSGQVQRSEDPKSTNSEDRGLFDAVDSWFRKGMCTGLGLCGRSI